jgi:hypothetical protein
MPRDRLGNDIDGIRVVEDPGTGAHCLDILHDFPHDGDRAQGHEEPARPLGLLPDHAVFQGNRFVEVSRLEAPWPVAGEHGVTIRKASAPVGRRLHVDVEPVVPDQFVREAFDEIEALLVEIDEHDVRTVEVFALVKEGSHGAWSAGASATDVGDLDSSHAMRASGFGRETTTIGRVPDRLRRS